MDDITDTLNKSISSLSRSLIDKVVDKSMLNSSSRERYLLTALKKMWIENLERGESTVRVGGRKRKLMGNGALSSFLFERVTPLAKVRGFIGTPNPVMERQTTFAVMNGGGCNKRPTLKKLKIDIPATLISKELSDFVINPSHSVSSTEDLILGMKVEIQLNLLLSLGGGSLSTSSSQINHQPEDLWTPARVIQINRGISSKKKPVDQSMAQIAVRLRLSSSREVPNGGEVEATWPSEYIRVSEDLKVDNITSDGQHQRNDSNSERHSFAHDMVFDNNTVGATGSSLNALELLLMDEEEEDAGVNEKNADDGFADMLRQSCGGGGSGGDSFDPLTADDDLDFFGLLGEEEDEDDELMRALTSSSGGASGLLDDSYLSVNGPSEVVPQHSVGGVTVELAHLASGEQVSLDRLQEAEQYVSDMIRHRPRFDLVPPQASDPQIRNTAARRSFTADRASNSSSSSSAQQLDLSSVLLSAEEDPDVSLAPDITIMGRLRKISRARQHYQFILYDVYVRETLSTTSSQTQQQPHHQQQYRDFILPVVRARLDGRELFVMTDDDKERQLLAEQRRKKKQKII